MKRYVLVASMLLLLASSGIASAQITPPTGGTPPTSGQPGGQPNGQNFAQHKAEILQHISEHLAKVQQRQSCVQAASDWQALNLCAPEKDQR